MVSGISKKVIFLSFLFINFLQPSKSTVFAKINKNINTQNTKSIWSKFYKKKTLPSFSKNYNDTNLYLNLLLKNLEPILVAKAEEQQELIIQSDRQFEINDVIKAEGNVLVSYRGKLLKADNLI